MIAGLEEIDTGELKIDGKRMNEVPAADRGIATVFQSYALYRHMTVAQNMGFALHDQVEAMTLADRIVVLNNCPVEQHGAPLDLYERPANVFVASFLGQPKMNFLDVTAAGGGERGVAVRLASGATVMGPTLRTVPGEGMPLTLGFRPDAISIGAAAFDGAIAGRVEFVEHLGNQILLHVRLPEAPNLVTVERQGKCSITAGADIWLTFDPDHIHLFAADGRRVPGLAVCAGCRWRRRCIHVVILQEMAHNCHFEAFRFAFARYFWHNITFSKPSVVMLHDG
jgi:ABC-type sugar transport system ATPase subunit